MREISCCDILSLSPNEQDKIIDQIKVLMELEYPNFIDWFNQKLIPGISTNERNIIVILKNDKVIGFVNLTKKNKEKKISNLYIKSIFKYKQYFNVIIDKSLEWLDTDKPIIILSKNQLGRCWNYLLDRNWQITDRTKNDDYILNRTGFFESLVKKKIHK